MEQSSSSKDAAVFLDLDNLVISARQANLLFDIDVLLKTLKERLGESRIVLQQSYGDWRQNQKYMRTLVGAGFSIQTAVALNGYGKNLADIQIVVDAMNTLLDTPHYDTYILLTGDRDFTPLVQALRKRGKYVIGLGIKHTVSSNLADLCDEYIYYEDIVTQSKLSHEDAHLLLANALNSLLKNKTQVTAGALKREMVALSNGLFDHTDYGDVNFRQFLIRHPNLVSIQQNGTTTYVRRPTTSNGKKPLHQRYRTILKKQRLRVIPSNTRLFLLQELIQALQQPGSHEWRQIVVNLADEKNQKIYNLPISRNIVNATLLLAREAEVIDTVKGSSLAETPVTLRISGKHLFKQAVLRCDITYLRQIQRLAEPFDIEEAAIALYETVERAPYLLAIKERYLTE